MHTFFTWLYVIFVFAVAGWLFDLITPKGPFDYNP